MYPCIPRESITSPVNTCKKNSLLVAGVQTKINQLMWNIFFLTEHN